MKQINKKKIVSLSVFVLLVIGVVCGVMLYQCNAAKPSEETELEEFVFDEESGMDDAATKSGTASEETAKQSQQVSVKEETEGRTSDEVTEESGYAESMAEQGSMLQEGEDITQSTRIDADDSNPSAVSTATEAPSQQSQNTTTAADEKNPNEMVEIPISANVQ